MNGKETSGSRSLRLGGMSLLIILVTIAIVIAVNVAVSMLPSEWIHLDLSDSNVLSISETTRTVVGNLTEDVTLYYIVQPGNEDLDTQELLNRYKDMSNHIKIVTKDPLLYPGFAAQYTTETLGENSIIVESAQRFSIITQADIYVSNYTYDQVNYTYSSNTEFDGENALTSAIDFVVSDTLPKVYMLSGHGETVLPSTLVSAIERQNIQLDTLDLLSHGAIPEDANCLLIAAPTQDITDAELNTILHYLNQGGRLMLITGYGADEFPNLMKLPEYINAILCPGIVLEESADYSLSGYQYYLLPELREHEITDPLIAGGIRTILPMTQGIRLTGSAEDGFNISPLLVTSETAYSKINGIASTTLEREKEDIAGPFILGLAASKELDNGTMQMIWIPSNMILDEETNSLVADGNFSLLVNSLGWMCEHKNAITIHGKNLMAQYLAVPAGSASRWSILFIGIIPAALLLAAGIIWYRRKRA